jgi:protein-S-isoprenylcysteine O-methyltransferase Ste14
MLPIARWAALSIAVIVFAVGVIPFVLSFNVAVKQSTQLVTDGIYRRTRHPHYLSNIIWGASLPFLFSSWWSLLFFVFSLFVVYFLIRREEETLVQEFGKEYEDYKARVPMLIPKW